MKARELIAILSATDPEAEVLFYDPEGLALDEGEAVEHTVKVQHAIYAFVDKQCVDNTTWDLLFSVNQPPGSVPAVVLSWHEPAPRRVAESIGGGMTRYSPDS